MKMTLFKALKALEGEHVTLISPYGNNTIEDKGILKVLETKVYPYNAFLQVNGDRGGFFAGHNTIIGINGKDIRISI